MQLPAFLVRPYTVFALTDSWTLFPMPRSVGRRPSKSHQLPDSPYRPTVKAGDRVLCWTAPQIIARRREILQDTWRVQVALDAERAYEAVWEPNTRNGHGAGLIRFSEYCHRRGVPELERFPASEELLIGFIGWAAGQLGSSAVRNWLSGLRAWHIVHGFPFPDDDDNPRIRTALKAVAKLAPPKSKRPPRPPVTTDHLLALYHGLDFTSTFDIALWAVACISFWALARLGETTVPTITFDSTRHVLRSTRISWDQHGAVRSVSFDIPWTKTTQLLGATLVLTEEPDEISCPYQALRMHLQANAALPASSHLFSYMTCGGGALPMVKAAMMARCQEIWSRTNLSLPSGHSFRIGGTSHLLSRGTDVQIVQKLGRWSSDSFYLYWRNTQAIIPLHIASAADRARIRAAVEEHLEGVDEAVKELWESILAARDSPAAPKRAKKPRKKS